GAAVDGTAQVSCTAKRCQHHHAARRKSIAQLCGRDETVAAWQFDIEQRDIGFCRCCEMDDLIAALRFGDDIDVSLETQQRRERSAYHRLILRKQHANHPGTPAPEFSGTSTMRRNPPPGIGPASTWPPSAAARSCKPVRPHPPAL